MRPARLPAACTVLVLTAGPVALGTVPALAADSSPTATPSAISSATPTVTPSAPAPSATTGPTATPSAGSLPTATPSATPTATGTPADCPEGPAAVQMPVTGSSTPGQLTVTFDNISTTTVKELTTTVALADGSTGDLDAELRAPGGAWKPLTVSGAPVNTGSYQLAPGQKLTLQLRATTIGDHRLTFTAKSEVLPSGSAPAKKYTCPQLTAGYTNRTPTPTAPTHLADTGAGTASRPLAIAGTTTLLLGATLLFLTRRRPSQD
ncbi:LPXTG cell wall anchor domain-containing protein [Kitasatospora sp. NPDC018058]|uniref:LPXTG cell wall anchor domain-containing protein n=1 Tax=Kitasatospora sp. NPDC018058 TaxID=3364025 RepID=UPI0037BFE198